MQATGVVAANEVVQTAVDGKLITVEGRILVEAQDGGLLLEEPSGRQWTLEPQDIVTRTRNDNQFTPITSDELAALMRQRLGDGFQIHQTEHYVIAYETSSAFAIWVGSLFERLLRGFDSYWGQRDIELNEPAFPLPVVILGSRARFEQYAEQELGGPPGSIIAYYHLLHNEVVMYDLTESDDPEPRRGSNADRINAVLSRPEAYGLVATIVHEATHQVSYNVGLQQRLADYPMWVNEGMAAFFETPDLRSRTGWRGIGQLNPLRLPQLKQCLLDRESDGLVRTLVDDQRFKSGETVLDAYAEAWGLVYYLSRVKRDEFAAYLRDLQGLTPLGVSAADERLELFREHFGQDLEALDREFVRYIQRQR
ncbi:MAG: DUF1570 domain-containing protein [Pirellulaceae bacterium]